MVKEVGIWKNRLAFHKGASYCIVWSAEFPFRAHRGGVYHKTVKLMQQFPVLGKFYIGIKKSLIRLAERLVGIHIHQVETMPESDFRAQNGGITFPKFLRGPFHGADRRGLPKIDTAPKPVIVILA